MKLTKEYKINNFGRNVLDVPKGTRFVSAYLNDHGSIFAVAVIPDTAQVEERVILAARSGEYLPDDARYITSVQLPGGLLLHIFEGMEE